MIRAIQRLVALLRQWLGAIALPTFRACTSILGQRRQPCPSTLRPLTTEQRESRIKAFIDNIDIEAVHDLASRHNNSLPCVIDTSTTADGSFNVVYFDRFQDPEQTLVIRIPIAPAIKDPWKKLCSEVCTMEYIRKNTPVPVPEVYAYGRARLLRSDAAPHAFMISECISGWPLGEKLRLAEYSKEQRKQFYSDFIEISIHLRGLEFSAAGSLMPSRWSMISKQPRVVSSLSISKNDLLVDGYTPPFVVPRSTRDYLFYQKSLLWDLFSVPVQDLDEKTAGIELFTLHAFDSLIQDVGKQSSSPEPFVLAHSDLRRSNIMVNDKLEITGIIDWEWAYTLPARFFAPPPPWITSSDEMLSELLSVLASKQAVYPDSPLVEEWSRFSRDKLDCYVANILHRPMDLVGHFSRGIFPRFFSGSRQEAVSEFVANEDHQRELREWIRRSEEYTKYLRDNNLYVVEEETEEARKLREWIEGAKKFL